MGPQLVPEQHTVAPNMKFLVPELAYFSYAKNAQLAIVLLILYFSEHSISTLLIKIVTNNHWFNHSHIIVQLKQIYKIIIEVREHYESGASLKFGTRMLTPA